MKEIKITTKVHPFITLRNVSKSFGHGGNKTDVLKDINLEVQDGEFLAIVGFSGSGKTTLMNLLAGLEKADEGEILQNGKPITEPGPERTLVFQNYSLLPWLTVYGNVAIAIKEVFSKWPADKRKEYAHKYIGKVGLLPALHKYPSELSGGMKQRVSLARALAMNPKALLLDEPLSALDALTRGKLQEEIASIWKNEQKTVVLITNDVDEALLLADRVIPLKPGPNATLGQQFNIALERPRIKTELNKDPVFIQLRNEITVYLSDISGNHKNASGKAKYILPDIKPKDLTRDKYYETRYGHGS